MGTVIDSLVVTLGLDSSGYKKGKAEAEAAQRSLKDTAEKDAKATEEAGKKSGQTVSRLGRKRKTESEEERKRRRQSDKDQTRSSALEKKFTEGAISRLRTLGLAAGGAVLGFKTLEGAIQAYAATSQNLANLGRLAPTVATSPKDINVLGNALKQAGGTQADANADIMKIAAAQFSLQMHRPDQFAAMARNMGVGLFDKKGNLRSKVDILTDIGKRLRQMTPDIQAQAMYARQMGLSEASIQLFIVDQAKTRRQILQDAERTNAVTQQGVQGAIQLSTEWNKTKNRIQSGMDALVTGTQANITVPLQFLNDPKQSWSKRIFAALVGAVGGWTPADASGAAQQYAPTFAAAEKKYGIPAGMLSSIARQESRYNANAVSPKGAVGLMQLKPKFFPNAGKDPSADINTAAQELRRLYNVYHSWPLALAAYNDGQGNFDKYRSGVIKRLPKETRNYVPSVLSHMPAASAAAAMASGATATPARSAAGASGTAGAPIANNTSVQIDNLHVHGVKDADDFARALPQSLRRKGVVTNANTGVT